MWDRETLFRSVSWLCYQDARGRNIYIRPKGEHHLSLVDDLTAEAIHRMKSEGFSGGGSGNGAGNFQAWLNHGKVLPKDVSTLAARFSRGTLRRGQRGRGLAALRPPGGPHKS